MNSPIIGAAWEGGKVAGWSVHENAPVGLILLPGDFEGDWHKAMARAEKENCSLPTRIDLLVLRKNLPKEFKDRYYWSCEEIAGYADYAWIQTFGNGGQNNARKGDRYLACAVRRVPIQLFTSS